MGTSDDSDSTLGARRQRVRRLFTEHVKAGMTLAEAAAHVDGATWLKAEDVRAVDALAGKIPVAWVDGERVFVITVGPDAGQDSDPHHLAIYLRVEGAPEPAAVAAVLRGEGGEPAAAAAVIRAIGFHEWTT